MKIFKLTIIFTLIATKGFSSVFHDTAATKTKFRPLYIYVYDFENFNSVIKTFDTSLNNINLLNPARKNNLSYQDLGLTGTPVNIFSLEKYKTQGFDLGFNYMNIWLYDAKAENEKMIYSPTPYSSLNYSQGEKELIFIEASHTQNINKRLNAGIDYRRIKTNNYLFYNFNDQTYDRVRIPNIYNLKLYSSFHSKNDKIYIIGNIIFNKSTLRESGGLKYPEMFDTTSGKLRAFENNLSNANNITKQYSCNLKTYYRFGKHKYFTVPKDSSKSDTISFEFTPKSYFFYNLNLTKTQYKYTDPNADTPYYKVSFWGKGLTDSVVLKELHNSAGFAFNIKNIISKTVVELSNYGLFNKYYGQQAFYNLSISSSLIYTLNHKSAKLKIGGKANYFIEGYNKNDYLIKAFFNLKQNNNTSFSTEIFSQLHSPEYSQNTFYSSHALWHQHLEKTSRNGISLIINFTNYNTKISFTSSNYKNYILYYKDNKPSGIDFNYLKTDIENKSHFKKIYFVNRFVIQKASKTYNLPQFTLNGELYFENFFFKKNMLAQIGFDYSWYSSFYADYYVPYTRQFVWQNDIKTGNYPYFGVFVRARVQTVNLYIKYEHINQGLLKSNYYSTYLYPTVPRFLSFGIIWRLFY